MKGRRALYVHGKNVDLVRALYDHARDAPSEAQQLMWTRLISMGCLGLVDVTLRKEVDLQGRANDSSGIEAGVETNERTH